MGVPFTRDLTIYPQRGSSMCILHTRPYYIPSTWFLTIYPSHETPTIYPQCGSSMCILHTRPQPETPTIYPNPGSLLWLLVKCVYRY